MFLLLWSRGFNITPTTGQQERQQGRGLPLHLLTAFGRFYQVRDWSPRRECTWPWSIVISEPGLTRSFKCSLMLIVSLEPSLVLLNTGNSKLMVQTFYLFQTLWQYHSLLSSAWTLKAVSVTGAIGSSQSCDFYFWSLPWEYIPCFESTREATWETSWLWVFVICLLCYKHFFMASPPRQLQMIRAKPLKADPHGAIVSGKFCRAYGHLETVTQW